jgi:hypothetical protein
MKKFAMSAAVLALLASGGVSAAETPPASVRTEVSQDMSKDVRGFCADAIRTVGTFGFHDYKLRHENMKTLFTDGGWDQQEKALDRTGAFDTIMANHLIQTSDVDSDGCRVVDSDSHGGDAIWTVRVGTLRTFLSPNQKSEMPVEVTMRLIQSGQTLLIDNWVERSL